MPIPAEFNDTEQLQSLIRRFVNRMVRGDFKDLNNSSGSWDPDVTNIRGAMRHAMTHKDDDSLLMTVTRLFLYFFVYGKARALQPAIVGVKKETFDLELSAAYKPQVTLYFKQDSDAVPDSYYPVEAEISFRLENETSETITEANLRTLATQIKNELAVGEGYTFDKGAYLCSYIDKKNGYELQIYALSEAEGEKVVKKIIGIRNHTFDEDKFKVTKPRKKPDNVTGNITILGKITKKMRWRPTAKVRFMYAHISIYNRPEPRCLVDRTGLKANPIEKTY